MARIKIRTNTYDPREESRHRVQIHTNTQVTIAPSILPYLVENCNSYTNLTNVNGKIVDCFDGYMDYPELSNIVISGSSNTNRDTSGLHSRQQIDYKKIILSRYFMASEFRSAPVLIISGQGSNSVGVSDFFRPLICTQNNAFYTPLPYDKLSEFLRNEYLKYCRDNRLDSYNFSVLKSIINLLKITKRNIFEEMFLSVESIENCVETVYSQGQITEDDLLQTRSSLRQHLNSFYSATDFLSYYFNLFKDTVYPIIGDYKGYNTSVLNSGIAFQIKLHTMSSLENLDNNRSEYNKAISQLLKADLIQNFNKQIIHNNLVVVLDHLSFEQAELFSWLWNDDSTWLMHQERVFFVCLQDNYPKQMMKSSEFDGKIGKWYYLNHNDGTDLESLFGEQQIYNTTYSEHTEYGGIFSLNRFLKIPSGQGTHKVPVYRPKYPRSFFQGLTSGEGLLKIRGDQSEHQFKCML